MMRDELYINGIKVELSDDTGVVLNFAAGDPSDMTAIASGSSYTVSLPLTAHNIQTLGFINHPGSTSDIPNKEHSARLVRGGIPIFENGKATVSGVGKTIDILLTWNRSDELEALSRAKMRDMAITDVMRMDPDNFELSETAYLKWIWNTGYVVNARSGGLGYDVRGFRPAVKVSWLLGKMLPSFSIRADYWAFIERQWIMLPTMLGNSDILSKIGFSLSGSYNYNTSEDKKPDALNRVGSSYTPLAGGYNLYFPQINSRVEHDYIYTPKRGSYRFQGSVNATMSSNSSASFKIIKNRTIVTDRDGNVEEEYETLFEQTLSGSLVSFDTTKELEEGDKIGIIVSYATAASNTVTLNMNVTFDALTAANTNTAYLLDYPIRENLPEISMLDFVKGVFGTIGLMTEHTIDGLHMFTADDVILSTDRKDISGMLVDEKETKLTFSRGLTKYNTLGYKDKTDYITFPADTYDKTEHAVVTLPFVLQDTIMYTKGDDKYNLAEGKDARLLLNDGTKSIQIAKRPTNGAVFTYRTLTLSAFTISGLEFETLADIYWRGYIGAFSVSPRIVTKRARLTPDFVQNLSFSKAVYDGQNYYMLLRVSDYNKYGLATLEMALIDGIELASVDLTNVILDGSGGVILFDGTTPALYEPPAGGSGLMSGKLIRELEEYTGEITEDIYMPIDLGSGPARKRKLFNIAHNHANKTFLDVINQGLSKESSVQFKDVIASGAMTAGAANGIPPDDLPAATDQVFGVVKLDGVTIKIDPVTGKIYAEVSSAGVSSWNELTDKPTNLIAIAALTGAGLVKRNADGTYNLDTTVYQTYDADLATIAAIADGVGYLKRTGQNTWVIDTNTYLTAITKAMVEAVLTGNITSHTHSQYLTAITKAMVEAVLTGIITSHQHNYMPISGGNFTNPITILNQAVWYAGNSGSKLYDWLAKNINAVNVVADGAITAGSANGATPDDLPAATESFFGVIKLGLSLIGSAGVANLRNRNYTTLSSYTDAAARMITSEIAIGSGTMVNTETISITLTNMPVSITKAPVGNIIANYSNWTGAGMKLSFARGGTYWLAFITNDLGTTITKDGIYISVQAMQLV